MYPAVFGATTSGKLVTLAGCQQSNIQFNSATGAFQTLRPTFALIDAHIEDPGGFSFSRADITFSHLSAWLWQSGFNYLDKSGKDAPRYTLTYDFPPEVKVDTPRGSIAFEYTFQTGGDHIGEVKLQQAVRVRVERENGITIKDWSQEVSRPLQDFLSLATLETNVIDKLLLYSDELVEQGLTQPHRVPIELVYQQSVTAPVERKRPHPAQMLFGYSDVGDNFASILNAWFRIEDELDSVCALFFSVRYRIDMYTEQKFLNYAHAAESYHRRRLPATGGARLRFGNRLDALLDEMWLAIAPIVGDKTAFVRSVVDTRNYLTHYDASKKSRAASGPRLFWLGEALGVIVQACLLRELALPTEKIHEYISKDWRYRRLRDEPWDQVPD
jgi:ApeA N-terminal domain 1